MKNILTLILIILGMQGMVAQPTVNLVPFASGFPGGISDIAHANDNRLFVVEQLGYISVVDSAGNVMPGYFLDIHNKVTPTTFVAGNEQGLLGLAFSPDYATNGFFYVNYTDKSGAGNTVISRFQVSANPNIADAASEEVLLNVYQPFSNHNGGSLAFGDDGYLYIALGDGGDAGDPGNRAQNPDSVLGKILRIDVSAPNGFSIPPSNPFAAGGGAPEIWAMGLRNPWKISFDRDNGNLWIGDVGQNVWEEVNFQPAASAGGENYGWRCYEANHPFNTTGCLPMGSYVAPVFEYDHTSTGGCAVTGGFVYRGTEFPTMSGYYFFSDYCNGVINTLSPTFIFSAAGTFAGNLFTTFGESNTGELFVGSQSNGTVYKIISAVTGLEPFSDLMNNLTIFPNPGHGLFTCEIYTSQKLTAVIEVSDIAGRVIYRDQKTFQPGHNIFEMDIEGVSSGTYQMKISSGDAATYRKLEIFK